MILLAVAAAPPARSSIAGGPQVVTVESGALRGAVADGIASWKGIPFAAAPTGDLRWKEPQPAPPWQGVREASEYGHDCMQRPLADDPAPIHTDPSEDCLFLNVWTPAGGPARSRARPALPVLVWIYGGGFVNGGSSPAVYDGAGFARRGIVFVSFNYRLGRFGFFAHPALTAAHEGRLGNYGIMDQIAALQWVQRNIAHFGGDPRRVTLFGESAGGGSVLTLMTVPGARGLFAQAMVMSGGGRSLMRADLNLDRDSPAQPSAETIGLNFASSVGIDGSDADALARLRALPAGTVLGDLAMDSLSLPREGPPTYLPGPFVDGELIVGPADARFLAGLQADVPLVVGSTSADFGSAIVQSKEGVFRQFGRRAPLARRLYDPTGRASAEAVAGQVAMDESMAEPARFLAARVAASGKPAWVYRFSYVAASKRRAYTAGAPHGSDVPFFFDTVDARYGAAATATDRATARAAHAYVARYAIAGDPNASGLPAWPRYDDRSRPLVDFTLDRGPVGGPDPWRLRLDLIEGMTTRPR